MTVKNNIPAGYKDSAVGIIPQEWKVKRLGTIAKCFSGGTPKSESEEMYGGTIPFIRSGEIHSDKTALFLTDAGLRKSSAKMVGVGDLIFALYGANSGDCAISQINGAINQAILCIRSSSVINSFLQPYLELQKDRFIAKYLQGGQGNLSGEIVSSYTIPVPPLQEQRKIAEMLGMWDEAIEKQSRLIEKLELRKRALMQRLLTGRTRLPGFIDEVLYKKLKPFIVEKSERNTNQTYTNVLSVTNNRGFINQAEQFDREVASDNTVNYKLVRKGQFAYNPSRVNVGSLDLLQTYEYGILSPMYIVFETRQTMDPKFLFYQLKSGWFVGHIPMYVQGSVRDSLSFDGLENMRFWIPSLPEQKAIAEVLTTADKEIATHRKKLDALRLQKRGLMQQLLTGKTRVKI